MGRFVATEVIVCPKCYGYQSRPVSDLVVLPCFHCDPDDYYKTLDAEIERRPRTGLVYYGRPMDRLQQSHTFADEQGNLYAIDVERYASDHMRNQVDKLVSELQKLKDENRDVLAENARMRRKGYKP